LSERHENLRVLYLDLLRQRGVERGEVLEGGEMGTGQGRVEMRGGGGEDGEEDGERGVVGALSEVGEWLFA
jgi:hypothetical protein